MPASRRAALVIVLVLVSVATPIAAAVGQPTPAADPTSGSPIADSVAPAVGEAAASTDRPTTDRTGSLTQVSIGEPSVTNVTYTGDGAINASAERLELWRSSASEFTATVETDDPFEGEACILAGPVDERTEVACTATTIPGNATTDVAVPVDGWTEGTSGPANVTVALQRNGSTVAASEDVSVIVLEKDGDLDGDGLTNEREIAVGSDMRDEDTDGDGIDDAAEVKTHETSPTTVDTDGDGLGDGDELEEYGTDPTKADTDGDGLPDGREVAGPTDPTEADTDGDGLDDALEINTYGTNATKADTDGDGLDDGAEENRYETNPLRKDTDGDGLDDALEVNTYETDPNAVDTDGDGLGDGEEVNEYGTDPTVGDSDGDGLWDGREVNTHGTDPTKADSDDDGLDDGEEVNRYGTDPTDADSDDDGQNDLAEVDPGPWGHHPMPLVAIGALATVMSVAGGVFYRSERGVGSAIDRVTPGSDGPSAASTAAADDGSSPEPSTDEVPPEFLSNEEQVHRLLDANDGRMRQAEIVDRTGWSKSKVSRVLSSMAEDEAIVKVDVGKGNVITLPNRVPPGAESPFDGGPDADEER